LAAARRRALKMAGASSMSLSEFWDALMPTIAPLDPGQRIMAIAYAMDAVRAGKIDEALVVPRSRFGPSPLTGPGPDIRSGNRYDLGKNAAVVRTILQSWD
jgi:hypothetical protein